MKTEEADYTARDYAWQGFEHFKRTAEEIKVQDIFSRTVLRVALGVACFTLAAPLNVTVILTEEAVLVSWVALQLLIGVPANDIKESLWVGSDMEFSFFEVVLIAPIAEEILFRAILQPSIKWTTYHIAVFIVEEKTAETTAKVTAIALTSFCFGLAHMSNPMCWEFVIMQAAHAAIDGVALGILREYADSVVPCIAYHACWNYFISTETASTLIDKPLSIALDLLLG